MSAPAAAADFHKQTEANVMVEFAFTAEKPYDDPFNTVTLDALFTTPSGKALRVPAFWAGGNEWRVRYASPEAGTHRFRTDCSDSKDMGLHDFEGSVEVQPYRGDHPLYKHGPLQVAGSRRYLEHADGTPFFWLGDTWWMGLSKRLQWPDELQTLAQDRKRKGYNVIQIVMGPPPDSHPFDPRSVNEQGFPWEQEYTSIRPEYYDAADKRIMYLVEEGFTPCMFGMWGYHMRFMGVERAKQHWRYLVARYGALPVVWCAAGEANLSWYLAEGFPYDDRPQVSQWTEVLRYIHRIDPFNRLVTAHPTGFGWSARYCTDDVSLLDFDMLQTPHGKRDAVDLTVATVRESYAAAPTMPVINGEAAYEMLLDSLPTRWTRQMFWLCMTNGAAGHTYGANGIWQLNRTGDPHGPSPHMPEGTSYGTIAWSEAMNLPGSTHIALGKKLFEQYEWQHFQPHPEWAEYLKTEALDQHLAGAHWIWLSDGDPTVNAPAATRYFRKRFDLPTDAAPSKGVLWLAVDDGFTAYLNGEKVASSKGWDSKAYPTDVSAALRPGKNVLAIKAENLPTSAAANPAGLLSSLLVESADGQKTVVDSDDTWRCAEIEQTGSQWLSNDFTDTDWPMAKDLGPYGRNPWGKFRAPQAYGPYAVGTPGKVRLIYVPEIYPIQVHGLDNMNRFRAKAFDPTSGETKIVSNLFKEAGSCVYCKPDFESNANDWVLILEHQP